VAKVRTGQDTAKKRSTYFEGESDRRRHVGRYGIGDRGDMGQRRRGGIADMEGPAGGGGAADMEGPARGGGDGRCGGASRRGRS